MRIGIDLDDVMAVCAVPYLRKFAEEYHVELPDEREIGWHLLRDMDPYVSAEERDRFRIKLYEGTFFSELELYEDCPAVLERLVAAGHELYFITARAERRRHVTETWLREKGILDYAKELALDAFCEDDVVITKRLAADGTNVFLFDQPWNRDLSGDRITRVRGWSDLAQHLGL